MPRKAPRVRVGDKRLQPGEQPKKPRRAVILGHAIDFTPPEADMLSLVSTSAIERQAAAGFLFDQANRWDKFNPIVNSERQAAFAALGLKIGMLVQFLLDTSVTSSADGQFHLDVEIDAANPAHYTIHLQTPPDALGIYGVAATVLPSRASPTVAVDENGVMTFGIPSGPPGEPGQAGYTRDTGHSGATGNTRATRPERR